MRYIFLIAAGFASACSTLAIVPVDYSFNDAAGQGGLELRYRNSSSRLMCLSTGHWPNEAGKFNQASDLVFLVIDGKRYPIEDFNTGYCIGGCPTYVEPGEEVKAFVPYRDFGLPEALIDKPKTLEFSPRAYACKRK